MENIEVSHSNKSSDEKYIELQNSNECSNEKYIKVSHSSEKSYDYFKFKNIQYLHITMVYLIKNITINYFF